MQLVPSAPLPISVGSLPLETPLNFVQTALTPVSLELVILAVSPKLVLMPTRVLPEEAVMLSRMTCRSAEVAQLPHER